MERMDELVGFGHINIVEEDKEDFKEEDLDLKKV